MGARSLHLLPASPDTGEGTYRSVSGSPWTRSFRPARPLDLHATLWPIRRGRGDPATRLLPDGAWRATRTPLGAATERLRESPDGTITVEAWGPGAEWLVERAPTLLGEFDDDSDFNPRHPLLRELYRRQRGLRICRTEAVYEAALATIIEQKVPGDDSALGWRLLLRGLGEPAPGPLPGLLAPPPPEVVARAPYDAFHAYRIEKGRAEALRRVAAHARRIEEAVELPLDQARRRLSALPGLGPWSAAEIALVALGDADAVSVGDYHLPSLVSWALAGERRGTDERMLELLEPYRGHRARVLRLLLIGGIAPPRHGPRLPLRDWSVTGY